MIQKIPKDKWKDDEIDGLKIIGFKPYRMCPNPVLKFEDGRFKFEIAGTEELKKIRNIINFIIGEKNDN